MVNSGRSGEVFILGGSQTDFARNWAREDAGLYELMEEATIDALIDAQLDAADIGVAHIGNFVGELFGGQGLLGGFMGHIHEDFAGMPTTRHEGACASGSLAILAAMADIQAGRYQTALVLGVELMRNVPGQQAADFLGTAAWAGRETEGRKYVWPSMFADLAEEYEARYGLKREHLAAIARKNFDNAKRNPLAQTRDWSFTDASYEADDEANPVIEGWMRRQDCGQVTDGAAALVLADARTASAWAQKRGIPFEVVPRIKGWGHTTSPMHLETKLQSTRDNKGYVFPYTRKAILDAYKRAGISGPEELDGIETHDCFTITEYMAIEHFGITEPGQAWQAIEEGWLNFGNRLPVNASGGLIGAGHPVGATGVRMMFDACRQVSAKAGDCQIQGAKNIATYNVGGAATANVCFVVGI